jgi:FMN-dependent NADH-azoreductase
VNLLHIDSSILGANSVSRELTARIVDRIRAAVPKLAVTYRDLATEPIGHLGFDEFKTLAGNDALAEFLAADIVVIGAPMYNFTIPSQLKAWIDRLIVAGKTFRYTETGAVSGLAGRSRLIVVISRGGLYGENSPNTSAEHTESYLSAMFEFIGITGIEFIIAEGLRVSPQHREIALTTARAAAAAYVLD